MVKQARDPRPEPAAAGEITVTKRFVPVGAVDETLIVAVMVVLLTTTTFENATPDGPFTLERRGRLRTRAYQISEVWGQDYFGDTKTLAVHVKRLRQKIEPDPHNPQHLLTVRGLGYRFIDQTAADKGLDR